MRFAVTTDIGATPETVWAVLTDVERWPEWNGSVRRTQRLDDGPFGVGSTVRMEQPRLRTAVWRVIELDPLRSFTWTAASGGVTSVGGHRLTPLGDDAVRVDLTMEQTGLLAPLVGLLASSTIRRYLRMEADGLKRHSERR